MSKVMGKHESGTILRNNEVSQSCTGKSVMSMYMAISVHRRKCKCVGQKYMCMCQKRSLDKSILALML
jgi:hypothetical protein